MPPVQPFEESAMRPPWKLALIGGEVTLLAAFTGVGIHLAMQPHRVAFRPPPLTLPIGRPAVIPTVVTPLVPARPAPAAAPSSPALGPALFKKFGQQDKNLLVGQWNILQRLTGAIERYVEARLTEQLDKKR
ncbi:MAG: hypothetical protein E6H93_06215 [Chloroflexi bacterium]|nr:MAG: hypothetical protein E6H93_06215 [Chloroflexota bacterium]